MRVHTHPHIFLVHLHFFSTSSFEQLVTNACCRGSTGERVALILFFQPQSFTKLEICTSVPYLRPKCSLCFGTVGCACREAPLISLVFQTDWGVPERFLLTSRSHDRLSCFLKARSPFARDEYCKKVTGENGKTCSCMMKGRTNLQTFT